MRSPWSVPEPSTAVAGTSSRALARAVVVLGLLLSCVLAGLQAAPAEAATGKVRGTIVGQGGDVSPKVKMLWFDAGWNYLGARKFSGGGYTLSLAPGKYHLQFVDQRPAYDVTKYAPADVTVTVKAGRTTIKNVRLKRGASIGGTVRAGGKPAGGARIVAANTSQNSFEVTANKQGQYALGGLPAGTYSVFTYDKKRAFVGKSTYLKKLKAGTYKGTNIALNKKAGRFLVDVYAGDRPYPGKAFVTAVSKSNGQFWTEKLRRGSVTFRGLYPGRYTLVVPGVGDYLGATLKVRGKVKSGRTSFGTARLTKRGATVSGRVVDANRPENALAGAIVTLLDGRGGVLDTAKSASNGTFSLGGQLTTRSDLVVRVGPGEYTTYLGTGTSYCKYAVRSVSPVAVTTGLDKALGNVGLPHLPDEQQDGAQCHTPPPPAP